MRALVLAAVLAAPAPAAAVERLACVGDSITFGSGLPAGHSYPDQLRPLLGPGWTVGNFGLGSKTMMKAPGSGPDSYWTAAAFTDSQKFAPDVVVILLGTNDAKPANWRGGANAFEADYRAMVALFAALPSKPRIHLGLPPPVLLPSFTIDGKVVEQQILPIIRRIAADSGAGLIDLPAAFAPDPRRYFGKGDGRDIGDGVHPNEAGARLIAERVAAALLPADASAGGDPADAAADAPIPVPGAEAGEPPAPADPGSADAGATAPGRTPAQGGSMPPAAQRASGCQCRASAVGPIRSPLLISMIGLGWWACLPARRRRRGPTPTAASRS